MGGGEAKGCADIIEKLLCFIFIVYCYLSVCIKNKQLIYLC